MSKDKKNWEALKETRKKISELLAKRDELTQQIKVERELEAKLQGEQKEA
jgi:hypothetical protein